MRKAITFTAFLFVLLCLPIAGMATDEPVKAQVDRTELPVKEPWYPPITTLDARDAKAPPMFADRGAKGRAQRGGHPARRPRIRRHIGHRRRNSNASLRQARQRGAALQSVSHHGAVLTDAASAHNRP